MSNDRERLARRRATFVRDAHRRLAALDAGLLALELDPEDRAAAQEALQALHTLKGNAGFVHLETVGSVAHALEEVLASAVPTTGAVSERFPYQLLRRGLDALCAMVAAVGETLDQPAPSIPVVEALQALYPHRQSIPMPRVSSPAVPRQPYTQAHVSASAESLDRLLELVEELAASHGGLTGATAEDLLGQGRHRRMLRELRAAVLQVRLLPIAVAFEGFDRLVRDLAERIGRQARLEVEGADTEVDRAVLEPIRSVLVHLIRNGLAHGIEPPEERLAMEKPVAGTIRLTARTERNGVSLEVADDGRGLDRQQIAARAVSLGLCSDQDAVEMPDDRVWAFLAYPGFSTHDRVDPVAGRGVGLGAVSDGVQVLRGQIEIDSLPGQGTTIRLWLPSMLALDELVLLRVGTETYAVPQASIERVCSVDESAGLKVLDLWARLEVPGERGPGERSLIVCHRAEGQIGLLADGVAGRDEYVVRPLPHRARRPGLLGAVVVDGGRVVLVLDVERL
jgi:two-component system chemotaxis sensor kinase CheA